MRRTKSTSQRGINLIQVAIASAALAAIAMAALYGMRYERNPLIDAIDKLSGRPLSQDIKPAGRGRAAAMPGPAVNAAPVNVAPAGVLRKCVIDGRTVYSDVDCKAGNPTSRVVEVHQTHGFEAPKVAAPEAAASTPQSLQDQAIEKATR
ncbi:DUF4124 domain-containing protein [Rugamonas sp.]|uniref:DUF4124 domain-containing protein n=1 Tax=Rugamonas sp. TaxID=1926287 RepID=UPI0025F85B61|nr:DUF4124 domain-containing protein [Rugamonas sp.]